MTLQMKDLLAPHVPDLRGDKGIEDRLAGAESGQAIAVSAQVNLDHLARKFAREGCSVAICARGEETLKDAVAELEGLGATAFGLPTDVSTKGEAARFVDQAAEALGGLDILVNNVGGASGRVFAESSDEDWLKTFDLNLFHAVRATRAALPHFRKRGGGSVVTVASISSKKNSCSVPV